MVDSYDYLLKFLIIGNASTGKTCILRRFIDDSFKEDTLHTIGVEFGTKIIQVGGEYLKLQIWDTAGQERFQCVTRSYYRGAAGALVVYDISCRESFNRVADWISSVRELAKPELAIVLVGNKSDLAAEHREVDYLFIISCFPTLYNCLSFFCAGQRGRSTSICQGQWCSGIY
ncbi:unnamed protein product [Hymenolepis diminuta]|uniref:Ras-related protein Rab-4A n=1 Tax=Hymenolepis diminuta TaxID=6216 RepID=A0A0R3STZ5_HYMDI|nr:unnamed protein product [Hymenolepis diminuta]